MKAIQNQTKIPKINLAQSLEQLSFVNISLKLKQLRELIAKSANQKQTQTKSLYWIELKIYKQYTIAILKIGRDEEMIKFKNQKSNQQQVNNQEIQMFQKTMKNIVKKQESRINKLMSIWHMNGSEENFEKEIKSQSDLKQYLKNQKIGENIEQFMIAKLITHQIIKYYKKNQSKPNEMLKKYLEITYSMEREYLKSNYRLLLPDYWQDQNHEYKLQLENLLTLNVIFCSVFDKKQFKKIRKLYKVIVQLKQNYSLI